MTCLLREHILGLPHSPGGRVARTYTLATLDLRTLDLARSALLAQSYVLLLTSLVLLLTSRVLLLTHWSTQLVLLLWWLILL